MHEAIVVLDHFISVQAIKMLVVVVRIMSVELVKQQERKTGDQQNEEDRKNSSFIVYYSSDGWAIPTVSSIRSA
jgi:hypothetical protein